MRSHHPRWVIIFFYPHAVAADMGPTAILPGATYTTIDHEEPAQDSLQDVLEAYLETDESTARKQAHIAEISQQLEASGSSGLEIRDQIRGHAESAAVEMLGAAPPQKEADRALFGDDFGAGQWKVLCNTGTAVIMDYNIFHRGTRRMPGGLWRAMFKLQFFRTTAPDPSSPSWDCREGQGVAVPRPFAASGASEAQQSIWEGVLRWLKGGAAATGPAVSQRQQLLVAASDATLRSSTKDIERVGAAYQLGTIIAAAAVGAAAASVHVHSREEALTALDRLLEDAGHNARRAAMYGLASAGPCAVELLMRRIVQPNPQYVVVAAVFALGEACTQPTAEIVAALGNLLNAWRQTMEDYCARQAAAAAAAGGDAAVAVSRTERSRLTSGGATSVNPADDFATAHQRGTATVRTDSNYP